MLDESPYARHGNFQKPCHLWYSPKLLPPSPPEDFFIGQTRVLVLSVAYAAFLKKVQIGSRDSNLMARFTQRIRH